MGFLDIIFPKHCVNCKKYGDYVCANCFATLSFDVSHICLICNDLSIDGLTHPRCQDTYTIDGAFCGLTYQRVMKKLIYTFKYQPYLSDLGSFLSNLLYEGLIQQEVYMNVLQQFSIVLIPVPLSSKKFKKRGYNQSKILAQGLSKRYPMPIIECLERSRDTKPQFGLKKEERKENMKGAFRIKKSFQKQRTCQYAFLIDDVLTTGTTLLEAANILKRNGFKKVWGICLARDQ